MELAQALLLQDGAADVMGIGHKVKPDRAGGGGCLDVQVAVVKQVAEKGELHVHTSNLFQKKQPGDSAMNSTFSWWTRR